MALLQIDDPLAGPPPLGIDLGTTHSVVAWVPPTGDPVVLRDCHGESLVPSVVRFRPDGGVVVGTEAARQAHGHPEQTVVSTKRHLGRSLKEVQDTAPAALRVEESNGLPAYRVHGQKLVTPVQVSAEILRELRNRAIEELGGAGPVVITVPAHFDDAQRQATKEAARLAGLEVLRLINEPTAASLAYGLQERVNGTFAVFDLGGGTFDVTILELHDGVFQVKATGGDTELGGDDMDRALVNHVLQRWFPDGGQGLDPSQTRQLFTLAREAKHQLTRSEGPIELQMDAGDNKHRLPLTRETFERCIEPLVKRTLTVFKRVLRDARAQGAGPLDGVVLVGGATRVPLVRRRLAQVSGHEPFTDLDPDQVVALGAAIQAEQLAGSHRKDEVLLLDVLPLSLGVQTMGGAVERILPRNTPIPAAAAQVFTTHSERQTGFDIHVVQGERELAAHNRSLARFLVRGLPPMPAGMARLEVRFEVDEDGLLQVSAREQRTGTEHSVQVQPSYGLTDEQIEHMLMDAIEHGEADVKERLLAERRTEAEAVLEALAQARAASAHLLEPHEGEAMTRAEGRLRDAMASDDPGRLLARLEDLDRVSKPFAGRRMNEAFQQALKGSGVAELESQTAHADGIESHLGKADT